MNKNYIQLKISNYASGAFAVSTEINNFKERKETK